MNIRQSKDSIRFITILPEINLKEAKTSEIQVMPIGSWRHPFLGKFSITHNDLELFKENFDNKVRGIQIAVDLEHQPERGAMGWFKELIIKGNGLFGLIDWNEEGVEILKKKLFKYISPEFSFNYTDAATDKNFKNVLFGAALTNRPFFKDQSPVMLSEKDTINLKEEVMLEKLIKALKLKEDATEKDIMDTIGKLSSADLKGKLDLSEKEVTKLKKELEGKGTVEATEVKALKESHETLKKDYDLLKKTMTLSEVSKIVDAAIKAGKIVPAQKDSAINYALKDREGFDAFIKDAHKVVDFKEKGSAGTEGHPLKGSAAEKVAELANALFSELKGEVQYTECITRVLADVKNKDIADKYKNGE